MHKILSCGIAAICFAAPCIADTVTIDFDNLPDGGLPANNMEINYQYVWSGVVFELLENEAGVGGASLYDTYGGNFALYNFVDGTAQTNANRADILRMTFMAPVSALSFRHDGFGDRTVFRAYDIYGALVETLRSDGRESVFTFTAADIAWLDATQSRDHYAFAIDDLSFLIDLFPDEESSVVEPVPLPASGVLLAGALVAGRLALRRRRWDEA